MSVASVGYIARVVAVVAACAAAAGSATSTSNNQPGGLGGTAPSDHNNSPPPAQQMDGARALGLWRSTFGAVKIEADDSHGGLSSGSLQGVWLYQRQGQEVVGYFAGNLRGNVLQFRWQEPSSPPLTGEGYLVFDVQGRQYTGRWWSDKRDRVGDWNGWRQSGQGAPRTGAGYGGQGDAYGRRQADPQSYPAPPDQRGYPSDGGQPYPGQPGGQPYPGQQPYQGQQQPYQPPPPSSSEPYQQPYPQQPPPPSQSGPSRQPQPRQQPYQQPYQPQPSSQPSQPSQQPAQQYY